MMKLIMLPYAGSIYDAYREWKNYADGWLEIISIDYDGKGLRSAHPEPKTWKELIGSTVRQIKDIISDGDEYILFGHSMGAKVAMDVYTSLRDKRIKLPVHVVFSGTKVFTEKGPNLIEMNSQEFESYFIELGGIAEEVLKDIELKEMVFDYLRNDIVLLNGFDKQQVFTMEGCIPVILNGDKEERSTVNEWKRLFGDSLIFKVFQGGHFFIFEQKQEVFSFLFKKVIEDSTYNLVKHSKVV